MKHLLTLIALLVGSAATPFLLLLASGNAMWLQGLTAMPQFLPVMHSFASTYVPFVWIPSLVILLLVTLLSARIFPALANRIVAGFAAGAIATLALDSFRQLGVIHGWLPMDTIMLFGKMIAGPQAPELLWTSTGWVYHYLNGASFGILFTVLFGRIHWLWAVLWALFIEIGMMTLPPMAPVNGPFGVNTGGAAYFLITLVAHLAFGIVLGLLAQHWISNTGFIFSKLKNMIGDENGSRDPI